MADLSTSRDRDRRELFATLSGAMRRASAQGVLFSQAVAERLGITQTDLESLDLVYLSGRVTAGQLAQTTGLTTGAVTGMIDRLEKAGYVVRERDPADRRKVFVRAVPDRIRAIQAFYEPMEKAWMEALADYTDEELKLLADFATRSHRMMIDQTARLRATGKDT